MRELLRPGDHLRLSNQANPEFEALVSMATPMHQKRQAVVIVFEERGISFLGGLTFTHFLPVLIDLDLATALDQWGAFWEIRKAS